jgi:hypothetical protein
MRLLNYFDCRHWGSVRLLWWLSSSQSPSQYAEELAGFFDFEEVGGGEVGDGTLLVKQRSGNDRLCGRGEACEGAV